MNSNTQAVIDALQGAKQHINLPSAKAAQEAHEILHLGMGILQGPHPERFALHFWVFFQGGGFNGATAEAMRCVCLVLSVDSWDDVLALLQDVTR